MLFLLISLVAWDLSLGFDVMLRVTSAQHVKAPTHRNPASPEPGGGARDVLLYSLVRTGTHRFAPAQRWNPRRTARIFHIGIIDGIIHLTS